MPDQPESKSAHILALARETLDDVELSRLTPDSLVLKAMRLARLTENSEVERWLALEIAGYSLDDFSHKYLTLTWRWIDEKARQAHYGPLAQIVARIQALTAELQTLRIPDVSDATSTPHAQSVLPSWSFSPVVNTVQSVLLRSGAITTEIATLAGIKSRVLGRIHNFVTHVYYERLYSGLAESIFDKYRTEVDARVSEGAAKIAGQLPAVFSRLGEGDPEAISQALTTCRRIIESLADALFPPRKESVAVDGKEVELGPNKHKNRLLTYVGQRVTSKLRKDRIRNTLTDLFGTLSKAVHSDVTVDEARAVVLLTYVFLGEVLLLPSPPS